MSCKSGLLEYCGKCVDPTWVSITRTAEDGTTTTQPVSCPFIKKFSDNYVAAPRPPRMDPDLFGPLFDEGRLTPPMITALGQLIAEQDYEQFQQIADIMIIGRDTERAESADALTQIAQLRVDAFRAAGNEAAAKTAAEVAEITKMISAPDVEIETLQTHLNRAVRGLVNDFSPASLSILSDGFKVEASRLAESGEILRAERAQIVGGLLRLAGRLP